MVDLYVYYKVRELDAARLAPRVRALQADLHTRLGVAGQLKRRPQAQGGLQTWMEVYAGVDAGFPALLDAAAGDAAVAELTAGPRHAEIFEDLPCA